MTPTEFKQIRKSLGFTQTQLAEALGWAGDSRNVRRVENGDKDVSGTLRLAMLYLSGAKYEGGEG